MTIETAEHLPSRGFIVIDPAIFDAIRPRIRTHLSEYLQKLRDSPWRSMPERIWTHGEKEHFNEGCVCAKGIPVNDNTMVELAEPLLISTWISGRTSGLQAPAGCPTFRGNY